MLGSFEMIGALGNGNTVHTVCPIGCNFTTIQAAVNSATAGDTIRITSEFPHTENNIDIYRSLHIEGLGITATIIQGAVSAGGTPNEVFIVEGGGVVTFKNMTIRHGGDSFNLDAGGIFNSDAVVSLDQVLIHYNEGANSGGINNAGLMTINNSRIENNSSGTSGGGIRNSNIMVINNSYIVANSSSTSGGGIANTGNLVVQDSTITGNNGGDYAGGIIASGGSLELLRTTIHANTANLSGGGIFVCWPEVSLTNVTISGNWTDGDGGGIFICNNGDVSLANVTISDNTADNDNTGGGQGGGSFITNPGSFHMKNAIIAGNNDLSTGMYAKAPDCRGSVDSDGYNLIGDLGQALNGTHCDVAGNTAGNQIGAVAELGPLQDNGGPTLTHALLPASPAINAGHPTVCTDYNTEPITRDQRGGIRIDRCDMGAFEFNAFLNAAYLPTIVK